MKKVSAKELNRIIINDFKSFEYNVRYSCDIFRVMSVIDNFKTTHNKMLIHMNDNCEINDQVCAFLLNRVHNLSEDIYKEFKRFRPSILINNDIAM